MQSDCKGKTLAFLMARETLLFNCQEGEPMKQKRYLKNWVVWAIITIQFCLFMLLSGECEYQWIKAPLMLWVVINHMILVSESKIYANY